MKERSGTKVQEIARTQRVRTHPVLGTEIEEPVVGLAVMYYSVDYRGDYPKYEGRHRQRGMFGFGRTQYMHPAYPDDPGYAPIYLDGEPMTGDVRIYGRPEDLPLGGSDRKVVVEMWGWGKVEEVEPAGVRAEYFYPARILGSAAGNPPSGYESLAVASEITKLPVAERPLHFGARGKLSEWYEETVWAKRVLEPGEPAPFRPLHGAMWGPLD